MKSSDKTPESFRRLAAKSRDAAKAGGHLADAHGRAAAEQQKK